MATSDPFLASVATARGRLPAQSWMVVPGSPRLGSPPGSRSASFPVPASADERMACDGDLVAFTLGCPDADIPVRSPPGHVRLVRRPRVVQAGTLVQRVADNEPEFV